MGARLSTDGLAGATLDAMDRGVREAHAPNGRTWWVKRGWVPRYRNVRDFTRRQLEGREDRWYLAPLRWYAGRGRDVPLDPPSSGYADFPMPYLTGGSGSDVASPGAAGVPDLSGAPSPDGIVAGGGGGVAAGDPGGALGPIGGGGGGADPGLVASAFAGIGGGPDTSSVLPGSDFASGAFGGGSLPGDGGASAVAGGGGGGGGGGDVDVDLGDGFLAIVVVAGAVLAALAVALVLWIVVLPAVLAVIDGAVLVLVALLAGVVRVLFRRPWDVVATYEGPDGDETWRWEIRGFHRAGRARDDVARAFSTSTDPDLAVARVLVDDPWDGDPPGAARSVRELRVP